jgi:hypothetical protein
MIAGPRTMPMQTYNPYQEMGILDPNIVKKGIDEIKEQMREV